MVAGFGDPPLAKNTEAGMHMMLAGPTLYKKDILKMIFYNCICIKMDITQARLNIIFIFVF